MGRVKVDLFDLFTRERAVLVVVDRDTVYAFVRRSFRNKDVVYAYRFTLEEFAKVVGEVTVDGNFIPAVFPLAGNMSVWAFTREQVRRFTKAASRWLESSSEIEKNGEAVEDH